jgi:hypothetical protein
VGPARPPSRTGLVVAIVAIAVVAVLAIVGIGIGVFYVSLGSLKRNTPTPVGPLTASSAVNATRGSVVYSDDFHDSASGWTTQTLPSGTTFTYTAGGYVIVAKGTLDHFATSPYTKPVQQVAIWVMASQAADAPVGAGYGVSCWRGTNAAEIRYDFIVTTGGDWAVDRRDGGVAPSTPLILKHGKSSAPLGSTPLAIQGMCATLADQHTIRLILFAGKQSLADFTDSATTLPDAGWFADLMVTSEAIRPTTVTATRFEVRDLSQ